MSDRLFFSFSVLLAASFVVLALEPFVDRPPRGPVSGGGRNAQDVTVTGTELHRLQPGDMGGLEIVEGDDGALTARMTRLAEQTYVEPRSGPHIVLAEDLEFAFQSKAVEVTVEARSTGDFAASQIEVNYMARADAESGWRIFDLTREFAPYSFTWTTPERGATEGYDYIGLRPSAPDKRRTMEVRSIRVRVAPEGGGEPAAVAAPPAG
jgi:hypothetical protein